jgi:hypothetical protein
MATAAIAAYGIELRLSDGVPLAPLAVTSVSATPGPIMLMTAGHGVPVGDVTWVDVAGVGGTTAANGTWVAEAASTTALLLRNSAWNATYTSGGTITIHGTFTHVAELVNLTPISVQFNMVDCSAHDGSGWGSAIPTQKNGVEMRVELNSVPDDPTHDHLTGLLHMALTKERRDFLVVMPDPGKSTVAFRGWVSDHGTQTPVDGVLRANPVLSIDGELLIAFGPVVATLAMEEEALPQAA